MTNRWTTKVSLGVLCAVIAFALVFAMAFAIIPVENTPTAYASTTVQYLDENGVTQTVTDPIEVNSVSGTTNRV